MKYRRCFTVLLTSLLALTHQSSCHGCRYDDNMCCATTSAFQPMLLLLNGPHVSPGFRQAVLNGSFIVSLTPGASVYSLASGGGGFSFQLIFLKDVNIKDSQVTFELRLAKRNRFRSHLSPADYLRRAITQCKLSCLPSFNRVICQVPNIGDLLPRRTLANFKSGQLVATPLNTDGLCGLYYDFVDFCFEINIDSDRVIFLTSEAQRTDFSALLRNHVSGETLNGIMGILKPISLDQTVIYLPDPEVTLASKVSASLILIEGRGLDRDKDLETAFMVSLSVPGVPKQNNVECSPVMKDDSEFVEFFDSTQVSTNPSAILCYFDKENYVNLLEMARPVALNGSIVTIMVSVFVGNWRANASFTEFLIPEHTKEESEDILVVVVPVIGAAAVVSLALGFLCCLFRSTKILNKLCPEMCFTDGKVDRLSSFGLFTLDELPKDKLNVLRNHRIDFHRVKIGEEIGMGHFGKVHRGRFSKGNKQLPVAIKFIQKQEAISMFELDHPNVLGAHGILYGKRIDDMLALVLPMMDLGDLRRFVSDSAKAIENVLVLDFAHQIARGMSYLVTKNIIHRDLAARNCLLDRNRLVKIGDFGLSRRSRHEHARTRDYDYLPTYSVRNIHRPLPIRWMSPECIENGVFSEQTDVWSFGVLLWELSSRCLRPFSELKTPAEVVQRICSAKRNLPQLATMPDSTYDIMEKCWRRRPSKRPSFSRLVEMLQTLLKDNDDVVEANFDYLRKTFGTMRKNRRDSNTS